MSDSDIKKQIQEMKDAISKLPEDGMHCVFEFKILPPGYSVFLYYSQPSKYKIIYWN